MPRRRESRYDFRGALNLSHSSDVLDQTELRRARNAVLTEYGAVKKRAGTQRVHTTAIAAGADVLGLWHWFPGVGRQLVAIAGGNLYHKLEAALDFTAVASTFAAGVRPSFAQHVIGGVPTLYIADGTLRTWSGSALAAVAGAPAAKQIAVYKSRMFATDGTKTIYWSKVADPAVWATPDGGQAFVETYDAEGITALEVVGSSLLIFKANSIARFTGVTSANIRIDQETEGVSPDLGTVAPRTVVRMEQVVFFVSDRGPYMASEAGVQGLGVKVEPAFDDAEKARLKDAVAVHHKARRQVWVFFPENGQTENNVGYCFDYRVGAWTGPWDMGGTFNVASASHYERDDGTESVVLGGYDGFVREADVAAVGAKDDVLRAGTGGTNVTLEIELPVLLFGDPGAVKRMTPTQHVAADLAAAGALEVSVQAAGLAAQTVTLASKGAGERMYSVRPGTTGRRITMTMTDRTAEIVQVNGVMLEAEMGRRVA